MQLLSRRGLTHGSVSRRNCRRKGVVATLLVDTVLLYLHMRSAEQQTENDERIPHRHAALRMDDKWYCCIHLPGRSWPYSLPLLHANKQTARTIHLAPSTLLGPHLSKTISSFWFGGCSHTTKKNKNRPAESPLSIHLLPPVLLIQLVLLFLVLSSPE